MIIFSWYSQLRNVFNRHIFKRRLHYLGNNVIISRPLSLSGAKNISIDDKVYVGPYGWLFAVPLTGSNSHLHIKQGSSIGRFCHICATQSVIIEENVLIAEKVYISDNLHSYNDITVPVIEQPIEQKKNVVIGEGSWIGENVCVIGASVGKHVVIGANSVVTKDIPDYSVAVGTPAKVIKKYDFNSQTWIKV